MTSVVHDSFAIERTYPARPEQVFAAWAQLEAKTQWFAADDDNVRITRHTLDFRVGGGEHLSAVAGEMAIEFDSTFYDIVENARIVWSYDMHMNGARISVSVATVEISAVPGGTRLVMTEQGAYLDGLDTNEQRAAGTEQFLDSLGKFLSS
jgi:uncharacterized protein YndB with AHSA1/START domain